MTSLKRSVLFLTGVAVVSLLSVAACARAPKFDTAYQAVLLDNGQVYYGKIQGLGTDLPVLTDVYYIQNGVNPQTKETTNVLVHRGNELHAPDHMVINARHIILVEPVSPTSKVAELIAQTKK